MNQLPMVLMMLAGRWGSGFAGWALVSTVIWFLFPLVPALADTTLRVAAILVLLAGYFGVNLAISWRKRRRGRQLAGAIGGEDGRSAADAAEEVAQLRTRMRQALERLNRGRRGGHLYDQPWYVMIGPPGSGKTTALRNSGLHFPLADEADAAPIGGVGGTRLCDWWFADEAVLIDTAGRYTTQDSDATVDKAGWLGFLDLLRRTRPRQPLNGVLVVLSLMELATLPAAERDAHATAVRRRIDELTQRLQVRVPVYVVLSKADQLRGFDAYFDGLDAAGRGQVWGMTFKLDEGAESFAREFRLLLERLQEKLVERLQAERAADRRALIGSFPVQVASLERPLTDFLTRAFSGSRLDPAPLLRGVYMVSATQEGTPIDRLTGMLARTFGVDQKRLPSQKPVNGRAYFVTQLLKDVILGEALLVSRPPWLQRRRRLMRAGGFAAIGLLTLLAAAALWSASAANRVAVEQADEHVASYRQVLSHIRLDPVDNDNLPGIDAVLQAAMPPAQMGQGWMAGLYGLTQRAKLHQVNEIIYQHALQDIFLPRLLWRLEQQMREQIGQPAALYDTTRVYLMLGGAGPLSAGVVQTAMQADWAQRFPGTLNAGLRQHLAVYLAALLAAPLPKVTLDGALVETARAAFSRVSLADRAYGRLQSVMAAQPVSDWSPAGALGAAGSRLFVRRSGKPLTEGISGFYTNDGFNQILLPNLPGATRAAAAESWVSGQAEQIPTEGPAVVALEDAVIGLYTADAQARWDAMLADLALAANGRTMSIQDLYVLASPQSPMRGLLLSITQVLRLRVPAPAAKPGAAPASAPSEPASPAVQRFNAHYQPLFDLVGTGGQAPLDNILRLINSLQQELASLAPGSADMPATLQGSGSPVTLIDAEAARQPPPVSAWLAQIATSGSAMLGSATHAVASATFSQADGPRALCERVVNGHFPFDPQSSRDAPIDDFVRLFAPSGELDRYYTAEIKPFVNTSGGAWRAQAIGGVAPPVDAGSLAAFQRAAAIRDAFFPTAGPPQVRFSVTPSPAADGDAAVLTLGGVAVTTDTAQFTWPGADGSSAASLQFNKSGPPELQATGPWALFRLLDQAQVIPRGSATFEIVFQSGDHQARYTLDAGSAHNPFARNLLRGFRCPVIR